jgi:multimeric flavodoxin WrbA
MKIAVLNGSPKGKTSVTMQYVHFIQKAFPQHELTIIDIAQRIKKIEKDEQTFQDIIEQIRSSDGVLWAFPLYILHVHGNYKRFIELVWEKSAEDVFKGRYAATLSTSIHYFDHTAHNYMQAICDDLDMKYVGAFSAEMRDLLQEENQVKLTTFADGFFRAIKKKTPTMRSYPPVISRDFEYVAGQVRNLVSPSEKKIVLVTDAQPHQTNLIRMIERFRVAFSQGINVINLYDVDIKGGCLGCLKCGYDNACAYAGKDGFIDFYDAELKTADIIIFAGAIQDRYLSSRWKTFFDRSFFNTHTPSLMEKQFGFIISGPLSQNANLCEILEAWVELQYSHLAGFVTDEYGDSVEIDGLLQSLAERVVWFAERDYVKPRTFLGIGGLKVFRDDIWGRLRTVFQADHKAYERLGIYDFPQRDIGTRVLNAVMSLLLRLPGFRKGFESQMKRGMIRQHQKVLNA